MTTQQMQQPKKTFLQALSEGESVVDAANKTKVHRVTLYRWRNDDPEFAAEWEQAYEQGTDRLEAEAQKRALDGSDTLLIFLLKGRRPARYRDNARVEVTGEGGGAVEVTIDHDSESARRILDKLVAIGLVEPGPTAALDAAPQPLLPAPTD